MQTQWMTGNSPPDLRAVSRGGGNDAAPPGRQSDFGAVFHLTEAGGAWQRVPPSGVTLRPGQFLNAITQIPLSADVIAVGSGGLILRSHHAGTNLVWSTATPVRQDFAAITNDSEGALWVVGDSGTCLRSLDDGGTWSVRPCPDPDRQPIRCDFQRVDFDADGACWAIGPDAVYKCEKP